jgi:hypothetical protein
LIEELEKLKVDDNPPIVLEIKSTTDFSSLIQPHLNKISGHTSFFQFKFKKEKLLADQSKVTKMFVKEDSLEEKWQYKEESSFLGQGLTSATSVFQLLERTPVIVIFSNL